MKICTYPQEVYCLVPPLVSNTFLLQLICNMAMTSFTSRIDTCTSTYRTEISLRRCSAALLARLQLACCSLNPNTTLLVVVTTQRFTCQTLSRIAVLNVVVIHSEHCPSISLLYKHHHRRQRCLWEICHWAYLLSTMYYTKQFYLRL